MHPERLPGVKWFTETIWNRLRGDGLSATVMRGSIWSISARVLAQALSLLQAVFLARLLSPSDYGVAGVAWLSLSVLDTLTDVGLASAVVQRRDDPLPFLNTIFSVQILRGVLIGALLILGAPAIAGFFDDPETTNVIRAVSAIVMVRAFANPGMILFTRQLAFRPRTIVSVVSLLVGTIASIPLAFALQSAWALVWAALLTQLVSTVASYVVSDYRPRPGWDWARLRQLAFFGKWMNISLVSQFILFNGDDILVGRMLGTTSLGFYQFAYRISNLPATELSRTIGDVMFPAFATLQHDRSQLNRAYLRVLTVIGLLTIPASTVLFLTANDLINVVFGEQWLPALHVLQILVLFGLFRSLYASIGTLFLAVNRPDFAAMRTLGQLLPLAIVAYPVIQRWGLEGIAVAMTLSGGVGLIYTAAAGRKQVGIHHWDFARALWPGFKASVVLAAGIVPVMLVLDDPSTGRLLLELGIVAALSPLVIIPLLRCWQQPMSAPEVAPAPG